MVGKVGALRAPSVRPDVIAEATQLAVGLVAGWGHEERDKIAALLDELREVAAENQTVYEQSVALKTEAEATLKAAREAQATAERTQADGLAERERARQNAHGAAQELSAARATHAEQVRRDREELVRREQSATKREQAATAAESAMAGRESRVVGREQSVIERERAASALEARLNRVATNLRNAAADL